MVGTDAGIEPSSGYRKKNTKDEGLLLGCGDACGYGVKVRAGGMQRREGGRGRALLSSARPQLDSDCTQMGGRGQGGQRTASPTEAVARQQ